MSIKRTIITTIVALAVVAMVAPGVAQGVTIDELLAQIAQLQLQLLALQSGGTTSGTAPAACAGVTFTRNLTTGSTGSDVKCLQAFLNKSATTQVSTTGAGSPGSETTYFGAKTLAAVKKYQAEQGFTPANQVGPLTRARLNTALAGGTTGGTTPVVIVPTGAGLTVQLAYDNPAAGTIVDTQGVAPLAKFTFVNGDNAEVKVTSLKLKRIGISADATLVNVYLFDGAKRLTDSASVASTVVNFNDSTGLFTVPAGGSKTISVLADVDGAVGETVAVQIVAAADVTSNASSVRGTFPVTGNRFTLADGSNLATFYFADQTNPTSPNTASIDPQNDYAIWYDNVVVGTRAVYLHRIAFRVAGSVDRQKDIQNFRLLIDGVQKGSAIVNADANDYVTFDLSADPVKLETGTRVIKVLADIIGGSNKNVYLSLRTAADVSAVDSQLNANLKIKRYNTSTSFTAEDSGTQSINSGTLTVTKMATSPSGNVVDGANNQTLAKFELKAAGEKVKVESLKVSATVSTSGVGELRNGAVYANGVQIGSTADIYEDSTSPYYTSYNFGSSLIVEPGSPVTLEVRSDIYDSDGANGITSGSTIKVNLEGSSDENNAYGLVSMATVDVPSSDTSGNTVTVRQGGLTLSKYTAYTDQSMVPPLTNAKLAHFTLTGNTTEAVNINTIQINLNPVTSTYVSNLYVKFGNNTTNTKASITAASNSWSINYSLASGETKDLIVYGDINRLAGGAGYVSVRVEGTTASSAVAKTAGIADAYTEGTSGVQSQGITYTSGTFTPALDGATPVAQIVAGGQLVTAGKFKFSTLYENYTITDLRFTLGAASRSAAIASAVVKDGDTVLATVPYDGANSYFNITGLSVAVPGSTTKVLTVAYNLSSAISSSTSTSQLDLQPTLDFVKYTDSQGTQTCVGTTDTDQSDPTCSPTTTYATSKALYAFKSIPTVTKDTTIGSGSVTAGTPTLNLYGWKVSADAKGSVTAKQTKFDIAWSDAGDASNLYLYAFKLYKDGTDITSLVTITDEDGGDLEGSVAHSGATEDSTKIIINWATEDTVPAGTTATYKLTATASGFTSTASKVGTDTVSLSMPTDTVNGSTVKYLTNIAAGEYVQMCTSAEASNANYNFIWSDNSALDHDSTESEDNDSTASTSGDWSSGYLVKDLPLSANTFVGP